MEITEKTALSEVVEKHPKAVDIMIKKGLHCIGCHAAFFETVGDGARAHGMSEEQIKEMLKEMNEVDK